MEELVKNSMLFLPSDEGHGETWKDVFTFLKYIKKQKKLEDQEVLKWYRIEDINLPFNIMCFRK